MTNLYNCLQRTAAKPVIRFTLGKYRLRVNNMANFEEIFEKLKEQMVFI